MQCEVILPRKEIHGWNYWMLFLLNSVYLWMNPLCFYGIYLVFPWDFLPQESWLNFSLLLIADQWLASYTSLWQFQQQFVRGWVRGLPVEWKLTASWNLNVLDLSLHFGKMITFKEFRIIGKNEKKYVGYEKANRLWHKIFFGQILWNAIMTSRLFNYFITC